MARGRKISVYPVPEEMTYFFLAQEFGWTPSQIDKQEPKKIKAIIHILSIYNKVKNQETERLSKKNKRK